MILRSLLLWADPIHTEWCRFSEASKAGEEGEKEVEREEEGES